MISALLILLASAQVTTTECNPQVCGGFTPAHTDTTVVCVKDSCYKAISIKVARASLRPGTKIVELK